MTNVTATTALALGITVGLSGCTNGLPDFLQWGNETPAVTATPTPTTPSAYSQPFDDNDVMFAQMMIVHHEQAVEMANLALANTATEEVLDIARRILATQEPEILTMTSWLDAAGAPVSAHHAMEMPGLADAETMNLLRDSTDISFDSLFLMTMIQHHEGAISMATDVRGTTRNDDVTRLSEAIIEAQAAEIDEMYALLGP